MKKTLWTLIKMPILSFLIAAVILFLILYSVFSCSSIIPAGLNLSRADWLAFVSGYLSFIGSIIVAMVATYQTKFYQDQEKEKEKTERQKTIQPVFVVNIEGLNEQLPGTADIPGALHRNIHISVENLSNYPVLHIIAFNRYIRPSIRAGEKIEIYAAYEDSEDIKRYKRKVQAGELIEILHSEMECDREGKPEWFVINYEDIDGHDMYQTFKLCDFDGIAYYSKEEAEEV